MAKYSVNHEVSYYECDVNQKMRIASMIEIAIKVSEEQSDQLDRGPDFVHQFGVTWVITNYQIKCHRLPTVGETITFTTEAMEYNKYFCYRYFWLHDQEGQELVKIEAVFALMNLENRKMSRVPEEIIAPYESEKVTKIKRYPKIEKIEQGTSLPYRVRFYDIDSNQHVNNAVYFNWMLDVLGWDFLTQYQPTEINIRFDREVEYGNQVESHYEVVETRDLLQTRHEIKIEDTAYCEANISWQSWD